MTQVTNLPRALAMWKERAEAKLADATAYCSGEFPCEASTAAAALAAEVSRLWTALETAIELADEGIGYAGTYFTQKWMFPERLAALRAILDATKR